MKKLLSIGLIILLLVSTIGVTVSRHYCGSYLIATSLLPAIEDACDADMPMDANACSDDHQHFAVDSPLSLLTLNYDVLPSIEWISIQEPWNNISLIEFETPRFFAEIHPPPSEPNIYTKVQSFLL